jgi:hypothetical protein
MSHSRSLVTIASCACLVAGLGLTPPATAAPLDQGTESESFDFVEPNFCDVAGLAVRIAGTIDTQWSAHPQGPDRIAYYVSQASISTRYTNVTSGVSGPYVGETVRTTEKDQDIEVGEKYLTITVLATGMAKVKDAQGRVIAANPGQVRYQVLIDHNGTPSDPFDDTFVSDLGLVRESTGRNDDFCEKVVPVLMS